MIFYDIPGNQSGEQSDSETIELCLRYQSDVRGLGNELMGLREKKVTGEARIWQWQVRRAFGRAT